MYLIITVQYYFCYRLLACSKSVRCEQEAVGNHDGRVEAKCGIVENNEDDHYDNDNDNDNEDHVEDDVELIRTHTL